MKQGINWSPMATAPKDKRILLLYPKNRVVMGSWNTQEFHTRPKPYWSNDQEILMGRMHMRDVPPIGWADII